MQKKIRYCKKYNRKVSYCLTVKNPNKHSIYFFIHSVLNFLVCRSQKVDLTIRRVKVKLTHTLEEVACIIETNVAVFQIKINNFINNRKILSRFMILRIFQFDRFKLVRVVISNGNKVHQFWRFFPLCQIYSTFETVLFKNEKSDDLRKTTT